MISVSDPNIRVACLTCLGSVLSVQAPMLEVAHLLQSSQPPSRLSEHSTNTVLQHLTPNASESGYHSNSNEGSAVSESPVLAATPPASLSSGLQTPTPGEGGGMGPLSWIIKLCVRNVTPHLLVNPGSENSGSDSGRGGIQTTEPPQPLPVRLESLQLLVHLAKGYFSWLRYVPPYLDPSYTSMCTELAVGLGLIGNDKICWC